MSETKAHEIRTRYEHEAKERKIERLDAEFETVENEKALHPDHHVNASVKIAAGSLTKPDLIPASNIKRAYELLPTFRHDELARIFVVAPDHQLRAGETVLDLDNISLGEQKAIGYETITDQLFAYKPQTDSEIWEKLLVTKTNEPG